MRKLKGGWSWDTIRFHNDTVNAKNAAKDAETLHWNTLFHDTPTRKNSDRNTKKGR